MSAETLRDALRAAGIDVEIEAHGPLAVLRGENTASELADDAVRARAIALAAEHGFTHTAVELRD